MTFFLSYPKKLPVFILPVRPESCMELSLNLVVVVDLLSENTMKGHRTPVLYRLFSRRS